MNTPQIHPDPYIVSKNDTLWVISWALYGTPSRHGELAQINGIADPTNLRTGTALSVPIDGLRCTPRRYKIKKDDTYLKLAIEHLGNSSRWSDIAKLNSVEPTKLRTGMDIFVPGDFRYS